MRTTANGAVAERQFEFEYREGRMAAQTLKGKTLFITGASRGIGLAIGMRAARDGANVAIAAKTAEINPKLPGTIYTAAKGGQRVVAAHDDRDLGGAERAWRRRVGARLAHARNSGGCRLSYIQ